MATAWCLLVFLALLAGYSLRADGSLPNCPISQRPPTPPGGLQAGSCSWSGPGWGVSLALLGAMLLGAVAGGSAEDARRRLRHDLHDGPVQSLLGLQMFLAHQARSVGDPARAAAVLQETGMRLQEIVAELRCLVQADGEPAEGGLDVERALASTVDTLRGATGTRLRFEAQPGVAASLSAAQGRQAVWLVRNALTNCLRHARAREAAVRLQAVDGRVCLEIQDDGDGFDPAAVAGGGGTGLHSMKQRAADLGGILTVQSKPGCGTCIQIEFPQGQP